MVYRNHLTHHPYVIPQSFAGPPLCNTVIIWRDPPPHPWIRNMCTTPYCKQIFRKPTAKDLQLHSSNLCFSGSPAQCFSVWRREREGLCFENNEQRVCLWTKNHARQNILICIPIQRKKSDLSFDIFCIAPQQMINQKIASVIWKKTLPSVQCPAETKCLFF